MQCKHIQFNGFAPNFTNEILGTTLFEFYNDNFQSGTMINFFGKSERPREDFLFENKIKEELQNA